ncbi:TIM barrel protein [Candidatus Pacearchaeota archaeon]|nr:TIM barrel protein [Candidatus Pacearchaeota archaeon]MBD3283110.1 TIM barrel protein [Candidatus Pacearchaeota archaeon]
MIRFGPAGIGPVKEIEETFSEYRKLGIRATEIPFTYGIFIKKQEDMKSVKKASEKFDIKITIHAPYWINLNSKEKLKIRQSKERILKCCEIGDKLGAKKVVFHAGYYSGMSQEETYENIKNSVLDMQEVIKKNNWKIKLAPETMGKINVFGSIDQIANLVRDTRCSFCLDFAHILARDKKIDYKKIKKLFPEKQWHCHFSGIVYGEKGERRHIKTSSKNWKNLLENMPKNKEITIINESPDPIGDSVLGFKLSKRH